MEEQLDEKWDIDEIGRILKHSDRMDYSTKVQEEKKRLLPYLMGARNKGLRAQVKHDMMVINVEVDRADDLLTLE